MPGLHAVLSASAAKRWLSCPPSARLEEKLKGIFGEKSSPYAEEGTQAHAVAELKLRRANGEINEFSTMRWNGSSRGWGTPCAGRCCGCGIWRG